MGTRGRRLVYVYVGSGDVGCDLVFCRDQLGGELVWRSEGFGAEVAAVRLGDGPARPAGRSSARSERAADLGGRRPRRRAHEAPTGGMDLRRPSRRGARRALRGLVDPSNNEIALPERTRLGVMEGRHE